jgi:hypothetical protein
MLGRFLSMIVWVLVLGASMTSLSFAQQPMIPDFQFHAQTIHEVQAVAQNWRWQAELQIAFVVAVIVFGALITIIQGVNRSWCKSATLVLGACITILTAVNTKVFSADYRVLQESAIDADQMIDQLELFVRLETMPSADVNGLEKQILSTTTQFRALQRAVATGKAAGNSTAQESSPSPWTGLVYAQSNVPSWVTQPPTDSYSLYFVGIGEGPSTNVAAQQSFDSAVAAGVKALSAGGNTDINRLRSFIASSSVVKNKYLTFDEKTGAYRFYTLLQISSDIRKLNFTAARNEDPCSKAATINERTWQRLELPGDAGTITLALGSLYRVSRGPEASHLYIIDSSSVYTGTSGKFDENAKALPAGLTKEFRFSEVKDFPPFKIHGAAYNLSITGIDHTCVGFGCQKLTVKLCRVAD